MFKNKHADVKSSTLDDMIQKKVRGSLVSLPITNNCKIYFNILSNMQPPSNKHTDINATAGVNTSCETISIVPATACAVSVWICNFK